MHNDITVGSCIDLAPAFAGRCALVFADPPFNIGHSYQDFDDRLSPEEYQQFTSQWVESAWGAVRDGGVLIMHGSIKLRPIYWRALIQLGLDGQFETEVAWHYRFGVCQRRTWIDGHCPWIILRKPGERVFNADDVLVESDRKAKYSDPRIADSERGGMRVPCTVWGIPSDGPFWCRVQGNSSERRPAHPNQLPEKLMERAVLAYTNPGDLVMDLFSGSGTLSVVCQALGRPSVAFDISEASVESGRQRLADGAVRVAQNEKISSVQ